MREYREYWNPDEGRHAYYWGLSPMVKWLIVANVAAFFALLIVVNVILPFLFDRPIPMGEVLSWIGLVPTRALGEGHVWQFFTYMFVHSHRDFLHLVFNMLGLYFFGREIEALYGPRKLLFLYIAAGVFAGLLHCISWDTMPTIGASGAVYAVLVLYACHFPHQKILFFFLIPLEVWIVVAVLIGFDLAVFLSYEGSDGVAHLAHLGGALFGYAFFKLRGRVEDYLESVEERLDRRERQAEEDLEAKLDSILEKISKDGMTALSKKERDFLKRASRHYQKKA